MLKYKTYVFFHVSCMSPPAAGIFSRSLPRGTQEPRRTLRRTYAWAPAELRGRCSGRSKVTRAGSFSRDRFPSGQSQAGPWNPPTVLSFIFTSAAVSKVPYQPPKARQPRYNSRASSLSLCDSHERCFCVCVCVRVPVCVILGAHSSRTQQHSQSHEERYYFRFCFVYLVLLCACIFFCFAISAAAVCLYHTVSF